MIDFDHVSYRYPRQERPVLRHLTLEVEEGEMLLVIGPSGSGKSTLLRCLNGLVPHFYGGRWRGSLRVAGRDPVALGPRGMSDVVGFVLQDPEAQFVVDTVEAELAFAMENQGLEQPLMRKRVEEALDQLNIAHLRHRPIATLSGGEKQRVAIAAVLTLHPRLLVLDEPTSQLDPQAAEEVLVTLRQLNEDLGLTVVLSEHRLERVVQYADSILYLPEPDTPPVLGDPATVLAEVPLTPPLVTLGKELGWRPLPLTIKAGRRFARRHRSIAPLMKEPRRSLGHATSRPAVSISDVSFNYGGDDVLHRIDLTVNHGEFVAIMGRNGSGKTTLLKHMVGLLHPSHGRVVVTSHPDHSAGDVSLDTAVTSLDEVIRHVGYVPQDPNTLLFADTVSEELAFTRKGHGLPAEDDSALLEAVGLLASAQQNPRDLSGGERQRAALAAILVAEPQIVLLDEPTRGLDYDQKRSLVRLLLDQRALGRTIVMVTHDVELVALCADRVVLMAEGEIVVDGPTRQVMSDSLVFATQVNKLFRDARYLTVEDVLGAAHAN
jgi:energy-coupling factor transport system ATP-binding protein